jgi:hypothetical protein
MSHEEQQILEFLKRGPRLFFSAIEISKHCGPRRKFNEDRFWAKPVLRRMELESLVESNPYGEFRLKQAVEEGPKFKEALGTPGASLGDTTIICIDEGADVDTDRWLETLGMKKPQPAAETAQAAHTFTPKLH